MRKSAILLVALVVALGLAPGCSRRRSDQDIATEIKAKMYSAPELKATSVDVVAKDGEVTLGGDVPNDAARYQAYKLASDTPGVTKVTDHMFINTAEAPPPPEPRPEPARAPAPARRVTKHTIHAAPSA
ncbi:MAG TPA: BON domain-containing protein, partial [Candidatus Acidoferrales bacterium]|nr:BON domain-containing protein [Candidatus Acidoferrales bacterium]